MTVLLEKCMLHMWVKVGCFEVSFLWFQFITGCDLLEKYKQ